MEYSAFGDGEEVGGTAVWRCVISARYHRLRRKARDWLLLRGYAIGSVNLHLTTLRTYAGLAMPAGVILAGECAAIRAVRGYGRTEGKHVDSARTPTRKGAKKAQPVSLTPEQAARLKAQPDTPQGRRDALLLCLLLDHGLRVGKWPGWQWGTSIWPRASCVSIVRRWTRCRRTG